jgi:ATP-dependent helicase HepA
MSEREPELGLGVVAAIDRDGRQIEVAFPATGEKRRYALGTPVLKRVQFQVGETLTTRDGRAVTVESFEDVAGLRVYCGQGVRVREDAISDVTSVDLPHERLMTGQADPGEVFDLRYRALQAQARFRQSEVRGFLGGRVELIPHQFYVVHEVATRQLPRVLLADEVGLGKTIEACLILQRLLAVGQVRRALVLVPESLTHQWFVELLRRFNLWFTIFDEERCRDAERGEGSPNPFLSAQLALCSVSFLSTAGPRGEQAVAAGWDLVIVDEAHHLAWAPGRVSPEYALVEKLAAGAPGLLLLTATPTQLGLEGHFARLRLLDPHRYDDYERFRAEADDYRVVALLAERLLERKPLRAPDRAKLAALFQRDAARLRQHLEALDGGQAGAHQALLRTLLDRHGPGRVIFRNTRAAMSGFPSRKFCPVRLEPGENTPLPARIARELEAEASGGEAAIRYSFKDDPRIAWLATFLQEHRATKVLLICKSQRKVAAIEAALQERMKARSAVFHEGLPLVQRDRNAAWFAEPDGAQILLCSEIGSEGRNFQFAHHLVLFDLPLNPGLLEQRIGRLDRIGQAETIRIHVPYVAGSADECIVEWYQRGLDAFETLLHGGDNYEVAFRDRLLSLAVSRGAGRTEPQAARLDELVRDTQALRKTLAATIERGRDRLLELNSFDRAVAERVIGRIRDADADPFLRNFLLALLDHFGVRVKEHEEGDVFLDPSHAFVEAFPSLPAGGMLATFDRRRAIVREDIRFLSADHPLVHDAIDLLIDSKAGTTAFGSVPADEPGLLLEAIFVLETVADSRWHVDRFLAPTPVRVVVDLHGRDCTGERDARTVAEEFEDATLQRFLERPEFSADVVKRLLARATELAGERSRALRQVAHDAAEATLGAELQRLVDLQKVNDHIRPEETALAHEQRERILAAIQAARLRVDALRLIVATPED